MQTEWHNYKSQRTGRVVGSYGYVPEHSEENLLHVYERPGQFPRFAVIYHVRALVVRNGAIYADTLSAAKTAAMRPVIEHIRGQGSLNLTLEFV